MKTKEDIQKLLLDFYSNKENMMLVDYYTSISFFDVIQKGRSETVHSAFIAWLLEGKEFPNQGNNSPLMHFLQTLLRRHQKYNTYSFDNSLSSAVYSGSLSLSNITVTTEKPVSDFYPDADNKDRLDIYITCETNIPTDKEGINKFLNIIIENKIDSAENPPKDKSKIQKNLKDEDERYKKIEKRVDNYNDLYQTDRYYCACESVRKEEQINIYVYLTAISKKELDSSDLIHGEDLSWCKYYIPICYQDILDFIIEPQLCMPNMSEKNISLLNEYVKCLSIPAASIDEEGKIISNDKQTIMAVANDERTRVGEFIKNDKNKELLNVLISLYSSKNYYTVGGKGLYVFEKALKSVFKDWNSKDEISIYKTSDSKKKTKILSKNYKEKSKSYYLESCNQYLYYGFESDKAIEQINIIVGDDKKKIERIAVDEDARILLEPFWEKNQALFLSVLHVLSESDSDKLYSVIYDQLSSRDNTKFSVNGEGPFSKIDIVQQFVDRVWHSINENDIIEKMEKINKYFKDVSDGPHHEGILLMKDNWQKKNEEEEQKRGSKKVLATERYKIIILDKNEYYLSTQWGGKYYSTSKNENFPKLLNLIKGFNKKYSNNQFIVRPI